MNDTRAMNYISANEGQRPKPYKDSLGYWTIGVGHRIFGQVPERWHKDGISPDETNYLFEQDYKTAVMTAENIFPGLYDYPEDAQMVLVDMCFQMGNRVKTFQKMREAVETGNWNLAGWELIDSDYLLQTPCRARNNAILLRKLV